ncbi:transcriptional regulator, ModE family protein [Halorubrum aidingense JCM 13560]|uniref:Transcriptional regulator, ModE family protein n=1 Tax=Halorubrum aidingense JCM 13560 TaxID=1230454 RepID=M0PCG6_9EURY|nr:LysR family transcriptional regulator [Halorubrum aidingense]EMA67736.1 transcriptional regulator, ModE family protein [Halorubrum aidingense JCM 13560]
MDETAGPDAGSEADAGASADGPPAASAGSGRGRAALIEGDAEFDGRDAALLRAVHESGSVAGAASNLGRSRARALSRIDTLEAAFGALVERQRGGSGGGGSRLTATGRDLLGRYDRLQAVVAATASVPETVLDGTIASVDGELADVDTAVGPVRGLHGGVAVDDAVQVRIGADAVTIYKDAAEVDPDSTSARNRLRGAVVGVDAGETVSTVRIAVDGAGEVDDRVVDEADAVDGTGGTGEIDGPGETEGVTFRVLITAESAARLDLDAGDDVAIRWKATATRVVSQSAASRRE